MGQGINRPWGLMQRQERAVMVRYGRQGIGLELDRVRVLVQMWVGRVP